MAAIRGWLNHLEPVTRAGGGLEPASRQVTKTVEFSGTQWGSLLYQYILQRESRRVESRIGAGADREAVPFPIPAHQTGRADFPHIMWPPELCGVQPARPGDSTGRGGWAGRKR